MKKRKKKGKKVKRGQGPRVWKKLANGKSIYGEL